MRKLSKYETKLLVEALEESMKSQIDSILDNITEIKNMIGADTSDYPSKLKSDIQSFYSKLDSVQTKLNTLKQDSSSILDEYPTVEVWSYTKGNIDPETFVEFITTNGLSPTPQKKGKLYLWDGDYTAVYTEQNPINTNGDLGKVYIIGEKSSVKKLSDQLISLGKLVGEDQDVDFP